MVWRKQIFSKTKLKQIIVLINADDADVMALSAYSKGKKVFFFRRRKIIEDGAYIKDNTLYILKAKNH